MFGRDDKRAIMVDPSTGMAKLTNAVAMAEGGRDDEVRYLGEIRNADASTRRYARKLVTA